MKKVMMGLLILSTVSIFVFSLTLSAGFGILSEYTSSSPEISLGIMQQYNNYILEFS